MHAPCRTVIVAVVTWQQARTLVNYVQPQGLGTPTLQLALRSVHGVVNQAVCCTSNGITCAHTLTVCGGGYGHVRGVKDCCTHLVWRACVHVLRHGGLLFIRWQWALWEAGNVPAECLALRMQLQLVVLLLWRPF